MKQVSKCSKCRKNKSVKEFCKRPWGYNSWCRECSRIQYRINHEPTTWWGKRMRELMTEADYARNRARREIIKRLRPLNKIPCRDCDTIKYKSEFHKNQYICKKCRQLFMDDLNEITVS